MAVWPQFPARSQPLAPRDTLHDGVLTPAGQYLCFRCGLLDADGWARPCPGYPEEAA